MSKEKGFTLIELLVVISIIAVLMALLMPALNAVKSSARDATCMSYLHQWGLVWRVVTEDNGGFFLSRADMDDWMIVISDLYDTAVHPKMWLCPNATKTLEEGGRNPNLARGEERSGTYYVTSYGINYWASNDSGSGYWRTPHRKGAFYAPIYIDAMEWDIEPLEDDLPLRNETDLWDGAPGPWPPADNEMQRCCIKRHGKYYVNLCTMDLSNKKRTIKELWRVKWHTEWDMTAPLPNPGWGELGGNWPMWMQDVPEPAF